MQPHTKVLHKEFETLRVDNTSDNVELNHFLYMDDLKLLARNKETLSTLLQATETFFAKLGFSLDASNSARTECYERIGQKLEKLPVVNHITVYKYLGFFVVDKANQYSNRKPLIEVIHSGVGKVLDTNLSSRNMVTALNDVVMSLFN